MACCCGATSPAANQSTIGFAGPQAYTMLVQFTPSTLHYNLSELDWSTLLSLALTAGVEGSGGVPAAGTKASKAGIGTGAGVSKHGAAIREVGQHLLGMYLFPAGVATRAVPGAGTAAAAATGLGGQQKHGHSGGEPEGPSSSCACQGAGAAWLDRLEMLRRFCGDIQASCWAGGAQLEEAFTAALKELLTADMLCQAAAACAMHAAGAAAAGRAGV